MADAALVQELENLKAYAIALKQEVGVETDKDERLAKRAELTSVNNRIAASENRLTDLQKNQQGKFLFLRVEFYFLEFVYFLWP